MLRTAALVLALTSPALADGQWHEVTVDGYRFLMPPLSCMVGPVPTYTIVYLTQSEMDDEMSSPDQPAGGHFFATHITVNHQAVIYEIEALPWMVSLDILQHELAHLRGCEHGNVWG